MGEPTIPTAAGAASAASAAAAGWKMIGGLAGAGAIGVALATVVVMCMTLPRTAREWAVALISTFVTSLSGGAYAILRLDLLQHLRTGATDEQMLVMLMVAGGLFFSCGLPGWLFVRAGFRWMERRKDRDIGELVDEARRSIGR